MTKTFKIAAAQGEVNFKRITGLPATGLTELAPTGGVFVVGHSESGNTHVLERTDGVRVFERTTDVPAGMRMLYAIVDNPTVLRQNAATPHETITVDPGTYLVRISREYDPFMEQARQVAD